jgi:L-ribulose-5-phosphate 4-epimerase
VTETLPAARIEDAYEANTGAAIVERFRGKDPMQMPAVLVASHAPFCWGNSPADAAHNAVILEEVAHMGYLSVTLGGGEPVSQALLDKHFLRKHGASAYYGQQKG